MPNTVPAESSVFRVLSFVSTRKWPSRRLLEWRLLEFNWGCDWTQNFESLLNYFTQILCVLSDFMNLFISYEKVLNTNVVQKDFFLLHSNVLRGPLAAACNLEPQVGRSWFTRQFYGFTAQPEPWVPVNISKLLFYVQRIS